MPTMRAASTPSRRVTIRASSMGAGSDDYEIEIHFQHQKFYSRAAPRSTKGITQACDGGHRGKSRPERFFGLLAACGKEDLMGLTQQEKALRFRALHEG